MAHLGRLFDLRNRHPVTLGRPRHNGDLVSNAWPGEWAGSPACQRCHNAHAAGMLVTCDHLYDPNPKDPVR